MNSYHRFMATGEQREEIENGDDVREVWRPKIISPSGFVQDLEPPRKARVPWKQTDTAND